jgi:SAM-dependent methyltransferase
MDTEIGFEDPFVRENRAYWAARSASYSAQHRGELDSDQHTRWQRELLDSLKAAFPQAMDDPATVSVLDAGCGPGFLSILLAEAGFNVTAIDYTPAMLAQARVNAGALASRITFLQMNAEELDFADSAFDAVVSRNLTWDLPHPSLAYTEWCRVLRPGGLLVNFDANWYGYLFDEDNRAIFEAYRANTAWVGVGDTVVPTDVDAMEAIAREIPLSACQRPTWDQRILSDLGMQVQVDPHAFERVWSDAERANHASTPLFRITARKPYC